MKTYSFIATGQLGREQQLYAANPELALQEAKKLGLLAPTIEFANHADHVNYMIRLQKRTDKSEATQWTA